MSGLPIIDCKEKMSWDWNVSICGMKAIRLPSTKSTDAENCAFISTRPNLIPRKGGCFESPLPEGSVIFPPMQIDLAKNVKIGKNVIINHNLTCMARGSIEIEDDVMIGPEVALLTANHDFADHWVLLCGKIHIKKNAWIGARAVILPGVTVGENAVVAAGAVVTKDVAANTVVGGNPARVIRKLEG